MPLPSNHTDFKFSADSCPQPGTYTITNSLYRCRASRTLRSIDNTPNSNHGYMMLVHDTTSSVNRLVYVDTLRAALLCGYEI